MDLIDTHQHLILRDVLGYGWTAGIPALQGDFDRDDYAAQVADKGVVATVFMETGVDEADYRAEARHVARMIGTGPLPMLGQIASCRPETDAGFEDWLEECGDLGVVGFRRILHTVPDALSQSDVFRANIRKIGKAGWPVDLCCAARQLPLIGDLVRACGDVAFMLDHCATNDMAAGEYDAWRAGMADLARCDNVLVKLSGMTAYVPADAGPNDPVRAVADSVLDLFGPARLVWGGDWPVVNLGLGLTGWIEMTRGLLAPLSAAERDAIAQGNARVFYGLPD